MALLDTVILRQAPRLGADSEGGFAPFRRSANFATRSLPQDSVALAEPALERGDDARRASSAQFLDAQEREVVVAAADGEADVVAGADL